MTVSLESMFLTACKSGDIEQVRLATSLRVDVNCSQGWALRRSIRYNHPQIWDSLLLHRCININLCNQYGLSALHTACRFNIGSAVSDLLRHPGIAVNDKTVLGSTPLMVAVKYGSKQAVQILIRDKRVDLDVVDNHQRSLEDVVGASLKKICRDDKEEILEILQEERRFRHEGKGRRFSLEEEALPVDNKHRTRVFGKLKELLEELKELQQNELLKVELRQEEESRMLQSEAQSQINMLLQAQEQERNDLMSKVMKEREELNTRHRIEIERLIRKQEDANQFLQRRSEAEPVNVPPPSGSPKLSSRSNRHSSSVQPLTPTQQSSSSQETAPLPSHEMVLPSQEMVLPTQEMGHVISQDSGHVTAWISGVLPPDQQVPAGACSQAVLEDATYLSNSSQQLEKLETTSEELQHQSGVGNEEGASGGLQGGGLGLETQSIAAASVTTGGSTSPWDTGLGTPDEGYLTSKDNELPEIIHSTCKELECPICMEVMAPPSRIWQCKMGHVICEACKERVRKESGSSVLELPCPTCKTAPFIGRNLALERVARSLFLSK